MHFFSHFLKSYREANSLTQQDLVEKLCDGSECLKGIDTVALSRWEKDRVSPSIKRMVQVMAALGISATTSLLSCELPKRPKLKMDIDKICYRQFGAIPSLLEIDSVRWCKEGGCCPERSSSYRELLLQSRYWSKYEKELIDSSTIEILLINSADSGCLVYSIREAYLHLHYIKYSNCPSLACVLHRLAQILEVYEGDTIHIKIADQPTKDLFSLVGSGFVYGINSVSNKHDLISNIILVINELGEIHATDKQK